MLALITLFLGIIAGLLLATSTLWIIKVKCPKCKKPKLLKQIIVFCWKQRMITGQSCQRCQRPKSQIEIF